MTAPDRARRLARAVRGVGLGAATAGGMAGAGVFRSMRTAYPPTRRPSPPDGWPATGSSPDGRVVVAVVLGASGSVISDALGPYEVFGRSPNFHVYTVSAGPTATLSGGLVVVPNHSFDDVDAGSAPEPDVVVVPAVVAPKSKAEAPLRTWLVGRSERGAHVLGVCAGSALLAATGLLDGRRATSHWSRIRGLQRRYPLVFWERGKRYVEDDKITTTAGVTSGVFGALRLVEQLAGAAEAARVGRELAYPGWSLDAPVDLVAQRGTPQDLAAIMAVVAPWLRPTLGVGLVDGTSEIAVAAPFEVYANSWSARLVPIAATRTVTTRHGLRIVPTPVATAPRVDRFLVPGVANLEDVDRLLVQWASDRQVVVEIPNGGDSDGVIAFDPMLRDLALHTDRATARVTAKSMEYPTAHLRLAGTAWSWRPTALFGVIVATAIGVGRLSGTTARWRRR